MLILGFVFFGLGVSIPDRTGLSQRVWSVPEKEVGLNPGGYRWANYLIMVSAVLTVGGMGLLAINLIDAGSLALASMAILLFAIGIVFWLFFLAFRITVIIWAAILYHENGQTPPVNKPLATWAYALGSIYMILGYILQRVWRSAYSS